LVKTKKSKENNSKYFLIAAFVIVALVIVYFLFLKKDKVDFRVSTDRTEQFGNIPEPQFIKEGELEFIKKDTGQPVKRIDIEIADNDKDRTQGLMYRRSMEEDRGMLFIFDREEQQGFWMKNTIISLDIMFVNANNEIVKIHKNTVPFSERTLFSEFPAIYVVEVNAGFTGRHGIAEGDKINFERSDL
jgi:uncharacterized protein